MFTYLPYSCFSSSGESREVVRDEEQKSFCLFGLMVAIYCRYSFFLSLEKDSHLPQVNRLQSQIHQISSHTLAPSHILLYSSSRVNLSCKVWTRYDLVTLNSDRSCQLYLFPLSCHLSKYSLDSSTNLILVTLSKFCVKKNKH